jgi:membrane protease YdiL (CAAX protease family)
MAMVIAPGPVGHTVFMAAKIWILLFPAIWYLGIEKSPPSWSPARNGGLGVGLLTGFGIAAVIVVFSWLVGAGELELAPLQTEVREMGLHSPTRFFAGAAGWTLVNSLIEEYVYRWFVLHQSRRLMSAPAAAVISATVFTAHHVLAVSQYLEPVFVLAASAGVFAGGLIWAWLYLRYRSIWPGWLSHVLADVAVFGVGGWLLFG